jgi:menaquinol-cytochrome c reductase iron-sulfur subunit
MEPAHADPQQPTRRNLFQKFAAVLIGGIVAAVPVIAGVLTFFDPLRRKRTGNGDRGGGFIHIAPLSALPADGVPRKFQVMAERVDAWNKHPAAPIGAVYLTRLRETPEKVVAFNVLCPHAKCFVEAQAKGGFRCPCHNSTFNPDGSIVPRQCVSPRGLDELTVDAEALKSGVIRVCFQNFVPGTHEKIPTG